MKITHVTDITVVTGFIENDIGKIMVGCAVLCWCGVVWNVLCVLCGLSAYAMCCVGCLRVRVVWWCVWCGGACGVVVREAWHAGKSPVCRFKIPPCVPATSPHVHLPPTPTKKEVIFHYKNFPTTELFCNTVSELIQKNQRRVKLVITVWNWFGRRAKICTTPNL